MNQQSDSTQPNVALYVLIGLLILVSTTLITFSYLVHTQYHLFPVQLR
jgi:hypothetical protein